MTHTASEPRIGRGSAPVTSRQPSAGLLAGGDAEDEVGKAAGTESSTP